MRIGIDARFYGSIGKGLGRYTQKLIENLESIDNINEYFIFLRRENFSEYRPKNKNFKKVLADCRWYTFSEQVNMPRLLNKYNLDLVHFPHFNVPLFYKRPFIITIHDLILIHFPTVRGTTLNPLFYWFKYAAYKLVIKSAIKRAKKIIAVSRFTKQDILKHYKVPEGKIVVTYESCDALIFKTSLSNEDTLKKYGIIKPYIVYVGNVYPHKNPEVLIYGFSLAKKKDPGIKLVFVGGEDFFYKRLRKFIAKKGIEGVIFTGKLTDRELSAVFSQASIHARPSFYEGFELPPLEAMSCGVPVICSDHACAREILGDAVYYFNPNNPQEVCQAIETIMGNENLRKDLIAKGYEQVKKYGWEKMARETLKIYFNAKIKNQSAK